MEKVSSLTQELNLGQLCESLILTIIPQRSLDLCIKIDKPDAFIKFWLCGQTLKAWNQFTLNSYQHQTTFFLAYFCPNFAGVLVSCPLEAAGKVQFYVVDTMWFLNQFVFFMIFL